MKQKIQHQADWLLFYYRLKGLMVIYLGLALLVFQGTWANFPPDDRLDQYVAVMRGYTYFFLFIIIFIMIKSRYDDDHTFYEMTDTELQITSGIIRKRKKSILLKDIERVDVKQSFLAERKKLAEIFIYYTNPKFDKEKHGTITKDNFKYKLLRVLVPLPFFRERSPLIKEVLVGLPLSDADEMASDLLKKSSKK